MRVEMDHILYDDKDAQCKCILSSCNNKLYAFVQCIDRGFDLTERYSARYWGEYSHDDPEGSIRHILSYGGKWPVLPD